MPTWKKYKLGDVAEIIMGQSPKGESSNKSGIGYPLLNGPTEFKSFNPIPFQYTADPKKISNVGDILFCVRGSTTGRMNWSDQEYAIGRGIASIRGKKGYPTSYVRYLIEYHLKNLLNIVTGSTFPNLSKENLFNYPIECPSSTNAIKIAEILGALDDKIELNLQMNKTLEALAMALYKHWFVDFGPFKEGEFVDSELGLIPKGWEVKRLGELLKIKHGFAFVGKYFTVKPNESLLLTPGNFASEGGIKFNWQKQKFYLGKYPEEYILKRGDLIIALTDLTQDCRILGSPAIIPDEDYKYLHNQRLGLIETKNEILSNSILFRFFNTKLFRGHVIGSKTGSTVSHTAPDRIYRIPFAVPKNGILNELSSQLKSFDKMIFNNLIENKDLIKTRDYLLPKLISGEIEVNAAENEIKEMI